jgi:hypothetical protein
MKRLNIKQLPELSEMRISEVGSYLTATTLWHPINCVNWPDQFSYKPHTKFMIARSESALYIHFRVDEMDVKAVYTADQDPVWQDSCVEFFVQLPNNEGYANFEFNCIGTALATKRKSRNEDIRPFSPNEMECIQRFASLGNTPIEKTGKTNWELTVMIPFKLIGIGSVEKAAPLHANLYKCGDATANPHYLSWSEINTPTPDFHRPEFFGIMNL